MQIKIPCEQTIALNQLLSPKICELKVLGMTNKDIALKLKINKKTIAKSLAKSLLQTKDFNFY